MVLEEQDGVLAETDLASVIVQRLTQTNYTSLQNIQVSLASVWDFNNNIHHARIIAWKT